MKTAVDELRTRARLWLKARQRAGDDEARLRDGLREAARGVGFRHWDHARRVLGGLARPGEDFGAFWHAPRCVHLLNEWHADLAVARASRDAGQAWLLPYARQFVVVREPYLREIGLDPADPAWAAIGRDLVAGCGTSAWDHLALVRVMVGDGRPSARDSQAPAQ